MELVWCSGPSSGCDTVTPLLSFMFNTQAAWNCWRSRPQSPPQDAAECKSLALQCVT